jgi:Polyketide cyclase / dehydrase and lipid transport
MWLTRLSSHRVLHIDGTARTTVAAPPARCLEVLRDVEGYPSWSSLIAGAERLDGGRIRLRAQVLGLAVAMTCTLKMGAETAVLRRVPRAAGDDEHFEAAFTVTPSGSGSSLELHTLADVHAPGPARLLRGRAQKALVDDLLADLASAV